MHGDRGGLADRIIIPDLAEQFFFAVNGVRAGGKKIEQVKFLVGQRQFLSVYKCPACSAVQFQPVCFNGFGVAVFVFCGQPFISADMRNHPRHKFFGRKRLYYVVVRAVTQPRNLIQILFFGAHHQYRYVFLFPYGFAYFHAVHAGQHNIQQNQVKISA